MHDLAKAEMGAVERNRRIDVMHDVPHLNACHARNLLDGTIARKDGTDGTPRCRGFTISLDGYGAGPNQSKENPLGVGGEARHNGTGFHFVTEGIEAAFDRAREASGGNDIRLGGGAATIRQYLQARLVDEMHVAVSPLLLGSGEHLLAG